MHRTLLILVLYVISPFFNQVRRLRDKLSFATIWSRSVSKTNDKNSNILQKHTNTTWTHFHTYNTHNTFKRNAKEVKKKIKPDWLLKVFVKNILKPLDHFV